MIPLAEVRCEANPSMFARVIAASSSSVTGDEITTMHLRAPRIVWGEILTHRLFSRNARSSRAVPVKTLLEEVRLDPFVPWHWTGAQKGMVGVPGHDAPVNLFREEMHPDEVAHHNMTAAEAWLAARDSAADMAEAFLDAGYHKQVANRLLEPFSWIDGLITATEWENFYHLRDHGDAEPHLQDLARITEEAFLSVVPTELKPGEWHLPYISASDRAYATAIHRRHDDAMDFLCRISAARCARISYAPFDGDPSYGRELERYNLLVTAERVHASPLEHQAMPDTQSYSRTVTDFGDGVTEEVEGWTFDNADFHGNLSGFVQARKLVPGEAVRG